MGRLDSLLFFLLVVPMIRFTSAFISRPARFILPLRLFASVTGTVYIAEDADAPQVRLFTREGCTLCDKVKVCTSQCDAGAFEAVLPLMSHSLSRPGYTCGSERRTSA